MLNLLSKFEIYSPFAFLLMKISRAAFLENDFAQVILFEIDCAIFCTNVHELFCQFVS